MADAIVVLNAGSSSIKFSLFVARGADLELDVRGQIEGLYTAPRFVAKDARRRDDRARSRWREGTKLGHDGALRAPAAISCAGARRRPRSSASATASCTAALDYREPVRVDATVLATLETLIPLAPLHQPHNLAPIRALLGARAGAAAGRLLRHLVPPHATRRSRRRFALPAELHRRGRAPLRLPRPVLRVHRLACCRSTTRRAAAGKTVVLHLGNGASMCAIEGGKSVATTMGFTAVDGLPMGTRSGALDPGVILYLMDEPRHGRARRSRS